MKGGKTGRSGTQVLPTWPLSPGPGAWLLAGLDGPHPSPLFLLFQLLCDLSTFVLVMLERVAIVKAAIPSRNIIPPVRRIGLNIGVWMSEHDYPHSLFPLSRWKNKSARYRKPFWGTAMGRALPWRSWSEGERAGINLLRKPIASNWVCLKGSCGKMVVRVTSLYPILVLAEL